MVEAEEEEKLIISNGKTKNEDINVLINKFQKKKREGKKLWHKINRKIMKNKHRASELASASRKEIKIAGHACANH